MQASKGNASACHRFCKPQLRATPEEVIVEDENGSNRRTARPDEVAATHRAHWRATDRPLTATIFRIVLKKPMKVPPPWKAQGLRDLAKTFKVQTCKPDGVHPRALFVAGRGPAGSPGPHHAAH